MRGLFLLCLLAGCSGEDPEVIDTESGGEERGECVLPIESVEEPRLEIMVLDWPEATWVVSEGILVFDDALTWETFLSDNSLESPFQAEGVTEDFTHQQIAIFSAIDSGCDGPTYSILGAVGRRNSEGPYREIVGELNPGDTSCDLGWAYVAAIALDRLEGGDVVACFNIVD